MLQRTRASQVAPVIADFIARFRAPHEFVAAGRLEADRVFSSLGLRWRATLFWDLHLALLARFAGEVPETHRELLSLPGVGEYAATAVRVFAFGQIDTVVDANVLRIFSRYYNIPLPEHLRRSKHVREWAGKFAPETQPACRTFNWALIDHGAIVCQPRTPRCNVCPISSGCAYGRLAPTAEN